VRAERWRVRADSDAGAGSVLALAIVGAAVAIAVAMTGFGTALVVRQRTIGAADAAALAAADVLLGAAPGDPCSVARAVAASNDAELEGCEIDGYLATVTARSTFAGIRITALSAAGPPVAR